VHQPYLASVTLGRRDVGRRIRVRETATDEASWPARALGLALGGYLDEHWVDVRQLSALKPVISARLKLCARKGFDGVEVDNIDGWDNRSGFPLTPQDAEAWPARIANEAHALGMFVL
jgi:hypothetical protein